MRFGEILKELRCNNGYSMDALVELYNKMFDGKMNKSTLSRYENGLQEPLHTVVINFSKLFNVTVDYLSGTSDEDIRVNNMTIGERIKSRRIEMSLTLKQLADAIGLNKSTLYRYEVGQIQQIKKPVLQAMASALKVNPDWLILKTDTKDAPFELSLTEKEEQLIQKYRDNPSMQKAVDTLLGIE